MPGPNVTDDHAQAVANAVVQHVSVAGFIGHYRKIIKWQMVAAFIFMAVLGALFLYIYQLQSRVSTARNELTLLQSQKGEITQALMDSQKALEQERQDNSGLKQTLKGKQMDAFVGAVAEKLYYYYVPTGHNKYTRDLKFLKKVVRAVVSVEKDFPSTGRTNKDRILRALAQGGVETSFNPTCVGLDGEVGIWQILPGELSRLRKAAKRRKYSLSSDSTDLKTSAILYFIHLEEKIHDAKGDIGKGVRWYNGKQSRPTYYLDYTTAFEFLSDGLVVDEKLFE